MRGLTHRKVGERAETTLGLVRYHFGSLEGLIEAVLQHQIREHIEVLMLVGEENRRTFGTDELSAPELLAEARAAFERIVALTPSVLARYELLLHAARHQELQEMVRRSRDEVVGTIAESLQPSQNPKMAARLLLAVMDGLLLHQVSAYEPITDDLTPAMIVAAVAVGRLLPPSPQAHPTHKEVRVESVDSDSTRERIVDAAIVQLSEEGMRGLTHRKVGERAGTTLGLVRYHFGSLDGLIEAALYRMVELQRDNPMVLSEDLRDGLARDGLDSPALWTEAAASIDRVNARPDLTRARFELVLHAARNPELQGIVRESRNTFVDTTTRLMDDPDPRIRRRLVGPATDAPGDGDHSSSVQNPEGAARMVLAMLDGLSLHQLSAHEKSVAEMSPTLLLATIAAGALLPPSGAL